MEDSDETPSALSLRWKTCFDAAYVLAKVKEATLM
jgi:hypothetical protein